MLFTTDNKRTWRIELVDKRTAPVKLAVYRPSLNQETSASALLQLFPWVEQRNVDTEIWISRSTRSYDI